MVAGAVEAEGIESWQHSGLSHATVRELQDCFRKYPDIQKVYLFGSRSDGTFHKGSDIDLAVSAPVHSDTGNFDTEFSKLLITLDELQLIYKMDVHHLEKCHKPALKEKMLQGLVLYTKE